MKFISTPLKKSNVLIKVWEGTIIAIYVLSIVLSIIFQNYGSMQFLFLFVSVPLIMLYFLFSMKLRAFSKVYNYYRYLQKNTNNTFFVAILESISFSQISHVYRYINEERKEMKRKETKDGFRIVYDEAFGIIFYQSKKINAWSFLVKKSVNNYLLFNDAFFHSLSLRSQYSRTTFDMDNIKTQLHYRAEENSIKYDYM